VTLIAILLLSVFMNTVSQLSLKRGMSELSATNMQTLARPAALATIFRNFFLTLWLVLLVPSILLWLKALSMTDLSFAYPFQSLSLVLITLGAIVFLKEHVTARQWSGIVLILFGIILIAHS
jgi:uncharacterized membrane protein